MMNEIKATINEQLQQLQILMHRASFAPYGRSHNPHRGQGRVLALLKLKPEMSQKELTYLLNMSKQAAAELIAKLEKSGYLTREPSEQDKRIMTVKLTDEGAKAAESTEDPTVGTDKILDAFTEDELATFSEYLGRIITQYEEQFPGMEFEQRRQKMEDFMSAYGHGFGPWHHRGHGEPGHNPGRGLGGHRRGPGDMGPPPCRHEGFSPAQEQEDDGEGDA